MTTWGGGPFDNDEAMDLVVALIKADHEERERRIRTALVLPKDVVQRPEASQAVAAAALVAAANGMPTLDPPELTHMVKAGGIPVDNDALESARAALSRVATGKSAWREEWEQAERLADVERVLEDIRAHL